MLPLVLGLVAACSPAAPPSAPVRPLRVVSLDYCADQYVLELLPRSRILALSPDADRAFSYKRASAIGLRKVPARAEDVLVLKPDLVVRSYGGGPEAERFFARAGVPVLQVGYAGDLAGVRATLLQVANGLGEGARGRVLAEAMDTRLAAIRRSTQPKRVLYMTPGGVTTGSGTLVDEMISAAGHANYQPEPGWRPLPLERLAYSRPDLIAAASFRGASPESWSAARHPVARAQLAERPSVALDGAATACGGWFVLDAIEAMARAGA